MKLKLFQGLNWGGALAAALAVLSTQPIAAPGTIAVLVAAVLSALGGHLAQAPK